MLTLAAARLQVRFFMDQLPGLAEKCIVQDRDFFLSGLDRYQFIVIDDEENDTKEEPDYATMAPLSFYAQHVRSANDVMTQYAHVMGHKKCDALWQKCLIPKQIFSRSEIDLIEETYNQRLFSLVAPSICESFYKTFVAYGRYRGYKDQASREILNSLLTKKVHPDLFSSLKQIHTYLYQYNPLTQKTFNNYIRMWSVVLKIPEVKRSIAQYDQLE